MGGGRTGEWSPIPNRVRGSLRTPPPERRGQSHWEGQADHARVGTERVDGRKESKNRGRRAVGRGSCASLGKEKTDNRNQSERRGKKKPRAKVN